MIVKTSVADGVVNFFIEPEHEDGRNNFDSALLTNFSFYCFLPEKNSSLPHYDHIALAVLLAVAPFVSRRLKLDVPLSAQFMRACAKLSFSVSTTENRALEPYKSLSGRPALAFSGGIDSVAALTLMPKNTVSIFLDRPLDRGKTIYKKDAALYAANYLREQGRQVKLLECDVEYIRKPVGFPVDTKMDLPLTAAIPAILSAMDLGLDAIAFGLIAESAYKLGHNQYKDFANSEHYQIWGSLFQAAGIPQMLVTAGISEVGTSIICLKSAIGHIGQSCMRGGVFKPCLRCMKCFRKLLLEKAILREYVSEESLDKFLTSKEVILNLKKVPIKHENIFKYLLGRIVSDAPFLRVFKERVIDDSLSPCSLEWLEKWYFPSIELVPDKYRAGVHGQITSYLAPMTSCEIKSVQAWSLKKASFSLKQKKREAYFLRYLKSNAVSSSSVQKSSYTIKPLRKGRDYINEYVNALLSYLRGKPSKKKIENIRNHADLRNLAALFEKGEGKKLFLLMSQANDKTIQAFELVRANASLDKHYLSGWCHHVNNYLEQFAINPICFDDRGKEALFFRLNSYGGDKIDGDYRVSIIVSAYNAAATIELSINSLINQTYRNIEIIIIDDCSSDSTMSIAKKLAVLDSRITLVRAAVNRGPYCAKNLALQYCSGDYITCHDADDWAHPQRIETQLNLMLDNPDLHIGIASMIRISKDCKFTKLARISSSSSDGFLRVAMVSAFFTREAIYKYLGGWDSVRFAGDSEIIARARVIFKQKVKTFSVFTMLCLDNPFGLTNDPVHGIDMKLGLSNSRKEYRKSYKKYHKKIANDFSLAKYHREITYRAFPVPKAIAIDIPTAIKSGGGSKPS